MDVTSLYTNIPNHEGLTAVARTLARHHQDYALSNQSILALLKLVLHCNNFTFDNNHYLQIGGTSMGTKVAPSFANIFMGELERKLLASAPYKPHTYLRFIDDIYMIWLGTETELQTFFTYCNNFHKIVKFTMEYSRKQIAFLDTVTFHNNSEKLLFNLYCKPTDKHCYLKYNSYHPKNCKNSGPYSQFIRIRRICSLEAHFEEHAKNLILFYQKRDYPIELLKNSLQKAKLKSRTQLLQTTNGDTTPPKPIPLVLTYDTDNHVIQRAVRSFWPILNITHPNIFGTAPIFANKVGKKITNALVRADFKRTHAGHTGRIMANFVTDCPHNPCNFCTQMNKSKIFKSNHTLLTYTCRI